MLARLDQELAPMRSAVDREGNLLRVEGVGEAFISRIVGIVGEMGYVAQPLEEAPPVSRWFGASETDELSQEEARALAERWSREFANEGLIGDPELLVEPLRNSLLESFRAAARSGAVEELSVDLARLRAILSEEDATEMRRRIDRLLGRPDSPS